MILAVTTPRTVLQSGLLWRYLDIEICGTFRYYLGHVAAVANWGQGGCTNLSLVFQHLSPIILKLSLENAFFLGRTTGVKARDRPCRAQFSSIHPALPGALSRRSPPVGYSGGGTWSFLKIILKIYFFSFFNTRRG